MVDTQPYPTKKSSNRPLLEIDLSSKEKGLYLPANNAVKNLLKLKLYILYD